MILTINGFLFGSDPGSSGNALREFSPLSISYIDTKIVSTDVSSGFFWKSSPRSVNKFINFSWDC